MSNEVLTTQIGSVPFDGGIGEVADRRERKALEEEVRQAIANGSKHAVIDKAVEQALDYSFRHNCAFLPELFRLGESLVNYIKQPSKRLCLDAFKERAKGREIVKVQIPGPQSVFSGRRRVELAVDGGAVQRIENGVVRDTRAYGEEILEGLYVPQVIFFFDEPDLHNISMEYIERWNPIFETFRKVYPTLIIGIHSCNNTDWDMLFSLPYISIVSCDWSQFGHTIAATSEAYKNDRNGKRVARGVNALEDIWDYRKGDLITPPCGLATKSVAECYRTLDMLLAAEKAVFT